VIGSALAAPLDKAGALMSRSAADAYQTLVWRQEVELVNKTGKGTAPWTAEEIAQIKAGKDYKDLGYTGHHINKVADFPAWQGDPRNIAFLKQGSGEGHMVVGHPGGTRAPQPTGNLIDRQAMLDGLAK
jgi:hypothetical protein